MPTGHTLTNISNIGTRHHAQFPKLPVTIYMRPCGLRRHLLLMAILETLRFNVSLPEIVLLRGAVESRPGGGEAEPRSDHRHV